MNLQVPSEVVKLGVQACRLPPFWMVADGGWSKASRHIVTVCDMFEIRSSDIHDSKTGPPIQHIDPNASELNKGRGGAKKRPRREQMLPLPLP